MITNEMNTEEINLPSTSRSVMNLSNFIEIFRLKTERRTPDDRKDN